MLYVSITNILQWIEVLSNNYDNMHVPCYSEHLDIVNIIIGLMGVCYNEGGL